MNITFDGKVAMVTGAASGIGLACAELLAASGAKVALADVHAENLAKATKDIESKGVARDYQLDVADVPAISDTVAQIRKDLGEVDVLVCCAGVGFGHAAADIPEAEWNVTFDINTKGLFFCNQAAATQSMIPRKSGSIVNIASIVGLIGQPPPFMCAHYHGSKAAVIGITRQEAVEWASFNIRVNSIAPAFVKTPFIASLIDDPELSAVALGLTPLGQFITVDDVATAVCFLASDAASMITGVTLPVDGGWTAR